LNVSKGNFKALDSVPVRQEGIKIPLLLSSGFVGVDLITLINFIRELACLTISLIAILSITQMSSSSLPGIEIHNTITTMVEHKLLSDESDPFLTAFTIISIALSPF